MNFRNIIVLVFLACLLIVGIGSLSFAADWSGELSSPSSLSWTDSIRDERLGFTLELPIEVYADLPAELQPITIVHLYGIDPVLVSDIAQNRVEIAIEKLPSGFSYAQWREKQPDLEALYQFEVVKREEVTINGYAGIFRELQFADGLSIVETTLLVEDSLFTISSRSTSQALYEAVTDNMNFTGFTTLPANESLLLSTPDSFSLPAVQPELKFPFTGTEQITCAYNVDDPNCHAISLWGLDFGMNYETIRAAHSGSASYHYESCGGNYMLLVDQNDSSYSTLYAHLSSALQTGTVVQGDDIAISGTTGTCSSGPHLHFLLRQNSVNIRPEPICGLTGFLRYQVHTDCWEVNSCPSPNTTFCDVPTTHPFYDAIESLYAAGLINGCREEDGNLFFCPDDSIIRQHAGYLNARWLYQYSSSTYQNELPPPIETLFPDVIGESEATRVIEMLYRDGVVNGFSDGTFRPAQEITRQEFVYMVMRILLKHQAVGNVDCVFPDTNDLMIRKACDLGIVGGYSDGTFRPDLQIDRGQAAIVICRAFLDCPPADGEPNPELITLRNNARVIGPAGSLCFTASASANPASMPGLTVTEDGMLACYQFATDSYVPFDNGDGGEVEYRISPFDPDSVEICYEDGPSVPPIVALEIDLVSGDLRAEIRKCYGGDFVENGNWCLLVNGQEVPALCNSYSAGDDDDSIIFDPMALGLPVHNTYQAEVFSADQPNDAKYSGMVAAWSVPLPLEQDYHYEASEDWYCGGSGIIEMRLDERGNRIEVEVQKCDGSDFGQNGYFYILLDGQRKWGPFVYLVGASQLRPDVDVYGQFGTTGTHTYQVELYSADQPTAPKYSGSDSATLVIDDLCHSLSTSVLPQGGGGVTVSPAPNCGNQYTNGTVVTLTANPSQNYEFDRWSGSTTSTSNPTTLTMNSDKAVTAHFTLNQVCYSLLTDANPDSGGYISISTPPNCPNGEFEAGTQVQLEANANTGYLFSHWSGDASGTTTTTTITMNGDSSATANFTSIPTQTPTSTNTPPPTFTVTPTATPPAPTLTPTPTGTPDPTEEYWIFLPILER